MLQHKDNNKTVKYNKGNGVSSVAFMFACPGHKEELAGRVVAGATGKNLDILLSIFMHSEHKEIRALFPSSNRYDYLITNASDIIHYPSLDGTSLPSLKEYSCDSNIERLYSELSGIDYVIAFGQQAKNAARRVESMYGPFDGKLPLFICSAPHLSFLSLNRIRNDVCGDPIERGNPQATHKRLEVIAKSIETDILIPF